MTKLLLAVDGSDCANRAAAFVAALMRDGHPIEVELLNVQPAVSGNVATFAPKGSVEDYHREEGLKALRPALVLLDTGKVPVRPHVLVGPAAETIVQFAADNGVEQIVMGTRGLGKLGRLLLGSVATNVIESASVPVTLIK